MKQFVRCFLVSSGLAIVAFADTPVLNVFASLAPNRWGSTSYGGYAQNALNALENGLTSVGSPSTDPTAYSQVTQIDATENVVTGFASWLGDANPQGAFAGELGNRLTFGLSVNGGGTSFSANDIVFNMTSSDANNALGYAPLGMANWSVGNFVGGSGTFNTAVLFGNAGAGWVQITDANAKYEQLVFVGMGNAPAAYSTDLGPSNTNQDRIDAAAASIPGPYSITGSYTLGGVSASTTVDVTAVPEPSSLILLGAMITSVFVLRRRLV